MVEAPVRWSRVQNVLRVLRRARRVRRLTPPPARRVVTTRELPQRISRGLLDSRVCRCEHVAQHDKGVTQRVGVAQFLVRPRPKEWLAQQRYKCREREDELLATLLHVIRCNRDELVNVGEVPDGEPGSVVPAHARQHGRVAVKQLSRVPASHKAEALAVVYDNVRVGPRLGGEQSCIRSHRQQRVR